MFNADGAAITERQVAVVVVVVGRPAVWPGHLLFIHLLLWEMHVQDFCRNSLTPVANSVWLLIMSNYATIIIKSPLAVTLIRSLQPTTSHP